MANLKTDLSIACSKDCFDNGSLSHVIFRKGFLIASDRNILIKQSLKLHGFEDDQIQLLNGYAINGMAFKQIKKFDLLQIEDGKIIGDEDYKTTFHLEKIKYPEFTKALDFGKEKSVIDIGINAKFITQISKITKSDTKQMKITFYGENKATKVVFGDMLEEDEVFILMPCLL